jgi:hypothetical protein
MAKRSKKRQAQRAPTPHPHRTAGTAADRAAAPSAATLFRFQVVDRQTHAQLRRSMNTRLEPLLWERDAGLIGLIRQAPSSEALLDLAPLATGLAEDEWERRIRRFGPEVLPLIAVRLQNAGRLDVNMRHNVVEKLVAELRWRGEGGAATLLECFDVLDDYGRSLACVVLGLLGARDAADRIWGFLWQVAYGRRESFLVGPLWALADLHDERLPGALADLAESGREFAELFGFLSAFGDALAVAPLIELIVSAREDDRYEPMLALTSVAHRIGRDALVVELKELISDDHPPSAENMADSLLARPAGDAEAHFALFHHGMSAEDLEEELGA